MRLIETSNWDKVPIYKGTPSIGFWIRLKIDIKYDAIDKLSLWLVPMNTINVVDCKQLNKNWIITNIEMLSQMIIIRLESSSRRLSLIFLRNMSIQEFNLTILMLYKLSVVISRRLSYFAMYTVWYLLIILNITPTTKNPNIIIPRHAKKQVSWVIIKS